MPQKLTSYKKNTKYPTDNLTKTDEINYPSTYILALS